MGNSKIIVNFLSLIKTFISYIIVTPILIIFFPILILIYLMIDIWGEDKQGESNLKSSTGWNSLTDEEKDYYKYKISTKESIDELFAE